ncbi:MAG: sensor histidine kinase [Acidobacteriota bacterium]
MSSASQRGPVAAFVVAAAVLAAALVVVAVVAARTLRQRDEAVRQGVLGRLANQLEEALREGGPDGAAAAVERFGAEHADDVRGIELAAGSRVLASWGRVEGTDVFETPLLPGPLWRGTMGHLGGGPRAGQGRGGAPLRLRLQPGPALGQAGGLAWVLVVGATLAALAIVGLAFAASRGVAERERRQAAEAEQERLAAVALAGAGLAHRIRNPLGAIKGTAQLMAAELAPPQRERAERVVDASERLETLVTRLLAYARPPEVHPERLELREVVAAVAARCPGPVAVSSVEPVAVWADREHVESIIEELLANARGFDREGALELGGGRVGGMAEVRVADRGPGLTLEPERAFDPYVTSRPDGTGLGLSIVRSLARANGGEVTLEPRPEGGTLARLRLPLAEG